MVVYVCTIHMWTELQETTHYLRNGKNVPPLQLSRKHYDTPLKYSARVTFLAILNDLAFKSFLPSFRHTTNKKIGLNLSNLKLNDFIKMYNKGYKIAIFD